MMKMESLRAYLDYNNKQFGCLIPLASHLHKRQKNSEVDLNRRLAKVKIIRK